MFDPIKIRQEFPFFNHHPGLIYLDNAATTQKPASVIERISHYYEVENVNIHRGVYDLAAHTSQRYEQVRQKIASFLGAKSENSIVYTSGTTDGINLVADGFLAPRLQPGDEVLVSAMEHHANLIPWQQLCKRKGARLQVIPLHRDGSIDRVAFEKMLSSRVKIVAVVHISNSLGTVNPVEEIISSCHRLGIPVLVDGAQSTAHYEVNVADWDVDFFVFSGHKIYGPTGTGVLYGKAERLEEMRPVRFGGDAIREVRYDETRFAPAPRRFEPGTAHVAGVIGLGCAIDFLVQLDHAAIRKYLQELRIRTEQDLRNLPGVEIIGTAKNKSAIISFTLDRVHPHDVATFLGADGIAVRAGHHCTQPLMDRLGLPGTTRASFALYNTSEEASRFVEVVKEVQRFFS